MDLDATRTASTGTGVSDAVSKPWQLVLELLNTRYFSGGVEHDELADPGRAEQWLRRHGVPAAAASAGPANAVLIQTRQALRNHLLSPSRSSRNRLNTLLANASIELRIDAGGASERLVGLNDAQRLPWQALRAYHHMVAAGTHTRLRTCEAGDCILFFYDNSPRNDRRWCSMSTCGNRHKARRHARRHNTDTHASAVEADRTRG